MQGDIQIDIRETGCGEKDGAVKPVPVGVEREASCFRFDDLVNAYAALVLDKLAVAAHAGPAHAGDFAPALAALRHTAARFAPELACDSGFAARLCHAAKQTLPRPRSARRARRVDELTYAAIGAVLAASPGETVLLPRDFVGDLARGPRCDPQGPGRGDPVADVPLFEFVVGNSDVRCDKETAPTLGSDEFRIAGVASFNGQAAALPIYNDRDARGTFDDGDSDSNDFEFVARAMAPGTTRFTCLFRPYEEDKLNGKDVKDALTTTLTVLETALQIYAAVAAIAGAGVPLLAGGTSRAILAAIRQALNSPQAQKLFVDTLLQSVADFVNVVLGIDDDAFTTYTVNGFYNVGAIAGAPQAFARVAGGSMVPANINPRISRDLRLSGAGRRMVSLFKVAELPEPTARGLYTLEPFITIRGRG